MKLWIDLTDFLNWRGNLTGIQRIQYNISKLYVESDKDVHFFVYNELLRTFNEVEFKPDEVVKAGVISASLRDPGYAMRRVNQLLRKVIRRLNIKPPRNNSQPPLFNKGDVVLIMGGVWLGTFIDDFEEYKTRTGFKLVHFAFDMIPSVLPGYVVDWLPDAFTRYQKKVFAIADGILAISRSTANDVKTFMDTYNINNPLNIKTVRIGEEINTDDRILEKPVAGLVNQDYILSVSTIEGRKNHAALFYALKEARSRNLELPKIVVVGRNGWLTDDIRYMISKDLDAQEGIILLNDVDDSELSWLYKNCLFTIFPSFYEGWGMPIAESLSHGKLCLSSNTSSMPEIAGDLIDYFSPYDTGEVLENILKYLDKNTLGLKEKEIRQKYHQTTWVEMFTEIDNFVNDIAPK